MLCTRMDINFIFSQKDTISDHAPPFHCGPSQSVVFAHPMDDEMKSSRKRCHSMDDGDSQDSLQPVLKKACSADSINGAIQSATSIVSNCDVMANVYTFVSCIESLCKLHFALGRFAAPIMPSVRELALEFCKNSDFYFLASGFVQRCSNLKHLTFAHKRGDIFTSFDAGRYIKMFDNIALPQSLQSIRLQTTSESFTKALLGPARREQLVGLDIETSLNQLSTFLFLDQDDFCYPNLTNLNVNALLSESCTLENMMANINSKSPYLRIMSILVEFRHLQACKLLDMTIFKHLEALSFQHTSCQQQQNWQFQLILPNCLEWLHTSCRVLNSLVTTNPIQSFEGIYTYCQDGVGECRSALNVLAPNLKTFRSEVGIKLDFLSPLYSLTARFPKLETIGGNIVAANASTWPFLSSALLEGKKLVLTPNKSHVEVDIHNAYYTPPFCRMRLSCSEVILELPEATIRGITHIVTPDLKEEPYQRLLEYSNLAKLKMFASAFECAHNLQSFVSLTVLNIAIDHNHIDLDTLKKYKFFMEECLPPSLSKLVVRHDDGDRTERVFDPISKICVSDVRSASTSLVLLLKRLPNLKVLNTDFPVVDIDEPQMRDLNLGNLATLRVTTCRNGLDSLDQDHLLNLQKTFSHLSLELCIDICQPVTYHQYPDSTKKFVVVEDVPACILELPCKSSENGEWSSTYEINSDGYQITLKYQEICIFKSRGEGKLY